MKDSEFISKLKNVADNYKTLYVMGCFGAPMNASNKKRYTQNHTYNKNATRTAMINAATDDTFGFDCVNLIKGILWGWSGNKSKTYGGATYNSNGVPDVSADGMITKCNPSTDFSTIVPGEAVWMSGHIGVYIGNGQVIECTPKWKNCVQYSNLGNISKYKTGNYRVWTKHGKLPYVEYVESSTTPTTTTTSTVTLGGLKIGDVVTFMGSHQYASSNSSNGISAKPGKATITAIAKSGKHPYHLIKVTGGVSNVYGWVDASDIYEAESEETTTTFKVGDTVNFTGNKHYTSANASTGKTCQGGKAKITQIYNLGKSKHPYHLVRVDGKDGCSVWGWVDAGSFKKI